MLETNHHIGRFLYNNYKQALSIISEYTLEIDRLKAQLNVTDETIEGWIGEERQFLQELKQPPEERTLEIAYVQALRQREKAEYVIVRYPWSEIFF